MIRALLVDDERLALLQLQKLLEQLGEVEVAGLCSAADDAIETAARLQPELVFLDIDMPEINGLEAAVRIQEVSPRSQVVFATAYDHYAVKAFELNALDYILKPVNRDRLAKTVERLASQIPQQPGDEGQPDGDAGLLIRCLGPIRFETGGEPNRQFRWRTVKSQELFAYLLHSGDRSVSKDSLIELLWPDLDLKRASSLLYTTIYQVRQSLKLAGIHLSIDNASGGEGYSLNMDGAGVDFKHWEQLIASLPPLTEESVSEHRKAFDFYTGDYFEEQGYLWAEHERQRLRDIHLHHALRLGSFYEEGERIPEALTVYQQVVGMHPFSEQGRIGLMKVYDRMGESAAVEAQYRLFAELLDQELGIEMPDEVKDWHSRWKLRLTRSSL